MSECKYDIPQWTWFNGQFLLQFEEKLKKNPELSISHFFTEFLKSQGLDTYDVYNTGNIGTLFSLLYGLLVVPKELWESTSTNFPFTTRNKFTVKKQPNNYVLDTLNFLRLLRNALSHANFSIDASTSKLTFWNINKKNKEDFRVEISFVDLFVFLSELGKYYINDVKIPNEKDI